LRDFIGLSHCPVNHPNTKDIDVSPTPSLVIHKHYRQWNEHELVIKDIDFHILLRLVFNEISAPTIKPNIFMLWLLKKRSKLTYDSRKKVHDKSLLKIWRVVNPL
jgi:hypothetical protein